MNDLPISDYAQRLLDNSTCCHRVALQKGDCYYTGIYNGLSYWGLVFDSSGHEIEKLQTEWDEEWRELPNFDEDWFKLNGYDLVSLERKAETTEELATAIEKLGENDHAPGSYVSFPGDLDADRVIDILDRAGWLD